MGQDSFNSIWMKTEPGKDFDPPACETGMMLVRRWQTRTNFRQVLPKFPGGCDRAAGEDLLRPRQSLPKMQRVLRPQGRYLS